MQVIVLASQKGGAGKTTLCGHLAVEAERQGAGPVALIDTDPQGGLAAWWNARAAPSPSFAVVGSAGLQATLDELRAKGAATVFVDTPPSLSDSIRHTIRFADLVVVPVQPSPHDLRAAAGTVELVRSCRRPMVFTLNRTRQGTRLTADAAVALSQHGTIAPAFIQDRQDYRASMTDGRTAQELDPRSRSAAEIAALWVYIVERTHAQAVAAP